MGNKRKFFVDCSVAVPGQQPVRRLFTGKQRRTGIKKKRFPLTTPSKKASSMTSMVILYFPIAHNTLCLPPKFCINYCLGNMQPSQENLKTIVYAKFGGQTKCIMVNWKIENGYHGYC